MHDYIKGIRLAGGSTLSPVDRLKLSIHIATSVADLHTIDALVTMRNTTIEHYSTICDYSTMIRYVLL